ncbi:etoposide-induced protein 2.4-domain-containing protein [Dichomitus squalens]|uniref:Etoposide-induced protein 2.4-domain-containing protein n=1 Tax=Dichomitus squalens TaxID=114155 RepID=A0A4Q9MNI2_9APHY|nr:etoposide-induced protein 2.4-domain-containing protein [Dichomitus squalens]
MSRPPRRPRPQYTPPSSSEFIQAPQYASSRSTYPTFLSLQETAWLQLSCAGRGLVDAFRWDTVVRLAASDSEVRSNVFKSLMLNTVSLVSIYFFDWLLLPLAQSQQKWFHRNLGWFYQVLWLLPVVGISFYLNSSWCTLIAKRTFTLQHGTRAAAQPPSTYSGMLNALATSAYRAVMVFTSVVLSFALSYVPYVGPPAGFAFLCWVDAYYCFEFIWIARGLSLSRRVRHLEERWAYYFAFGLPSAALCTWGSSLANAALFALFFPAYIIMAMYAKPVPLDPYDPTSSARGGSGNDDTIHYPSPLIPIRIPVFAPVIFLNDWIVRILSVGAGGSASASYSGSGRGGARHQRVPSDGAESIEEGEAVDMDTMSARSPAGDTGRVRIRGLGQSVPAARTGRKFD